MKSLLLEPWDRSRPQGWLLVCVVAVIAVFSGLVVERSIRTGQPYGGHGFAPNARELRVVRSARPGLRVLFIGNSFTAAYSLAETVNRLAATNRSRPRAIFPVEYDPGGSTLQAAFNNPQLRHLLEGVRWNFVILQEQSQLPELPNWLTNVTLPAVQRLTTLIRKNGASPLLFQTWGYQKGDVMNTPGDTYAAMQMRLEDGYSFLGANQGIPVAPVGDAWARALRQRPSAQLWDTDGRHPSPEGSYLAAAVITTMLDVYDRPGGRLIDSRDTTYTAGLDPPCGSMATRRRS